MSAIKNNLEPSKEVKTDAEYRAMLEAWMRKERPYLNPDFKLVDLREVLPLNRTYLSKLINKEFGCTFTEYITGYRIEEAKRIMRCYPDMKIQEVAQRSGFASSTVFGRVFARKTGQTPSKWRTV